MSIMVWNCIGALRPNLQQSITNTVNTNSPDILIVTKTRIEGNLFRNSSLVKIRITVEFQKSLYVKGVKVLNDEYFPLFIEV